MKKKSSSVLACLSLQGLHLHTLWHPWCQTWDFLNIFFNSFNLNYIKITRDLGFKLTLRVIKTNLWLERQGLECFAGDHEAFLMRDLRRRQFFTKISNFLSSPLCLSFWFWFLNSWGCFRSSFRIRCSQFMTNDLGFWFIISWRRILFILNISSFQLLVNTWSLFACLYIWFEIERWKSIGTWMEYRVVTIRWRYL